MTGAHGACANVHCESAMLSLFLPLPLRARPRSASERAERPVGSLLRGERFVSVVGSARQAARHAEQGRRG